MRDSHPYERFRHRRHRTYGLRRAFTLMELLVATAMFVTAVGLLAGATSTSLAARTTLKRVENIDAALNTALGVVSTIDWGVLLDGRFNLPGLCPDEPLYAGFGAESCTTVGSVTYRLSWEFEILTDVGDGAAIAPFSGDSAQLAVSTERPDGSTARRATVLRAPMKGYAVDEYGNALGTVSVTFSGDVSNFTGPLLLLGGNGLSTVVASSDIVDGGAVLRASPAMCTTTTPCRLGLDVGTRRGYNLDHSLDAATVVGDDGAIVIDAGAIQYRTAEIRTRTTVEFMLQAVDDITGRRLHTDSADRPPHQRSVCVWLGFDDGHDTQLHPYCNSDLQGRVITVRTYTPDAAQPTVVLPIPTGTPITLYADHPDGECPVIAGQTYSLASTWSMVGGVGVCSSWTWGRPGDVRLDGVTYGVDTDAFELPQRSSTVAELIWDGPEGRPAAGVPGQADPVWSKPRSATLCPGWPGVCEPPWLTQRDVTAAENGSDPDWTAVAGSGVGQHVVAAAATTGDGTQVVGGRLRHSSPSTMSFTPSDSPLNASFDSNGQGFIAAVENGRWQWLRTLAAGSTVHDVAAAGSDRVAVAGSFSGSATFITDQGPLSLLSDGGKDAFVGVLTTTGVWEWVTGVGGAGDDEAVGVDVSPAGRVMVVGTFTSDVTIPTSPGSLLVNADTAVSNADRADFFVGAVDDGVWSWANAVGGAGADRVADLAVTSDGGGYVVGTFNTALTFATVQQPTPLTPNGDQDLFVGRFDSAGTWMWATAVGAAGSVTAALSVTETTSNTAAVSGLFTNTVTFGSSGEVVSLGGEDLFAAEIGNDGQWRWVASAGGSGDDRANGIVSDGDTITVTGHHTNGARFSTIEGDVVLNTAANANTFVARVGTDGNWLWASRTLGTAAETHSGEAITSSPTGGVTIAGTTTAPLTFPTVNGGVTIPTGGVFAARIGDNGLWKLVDAGGGCTPATASCLSLRASAPFLTTLAVAGTPSRWPWTVITPAGVTRDFTSTFDDVEGDQVTVTVTRLPSGGVLSVCTPGCNPVSEGTVLGPFATPATLSWRWVAPASVADAHTVALTLSDNTGSVPRQEQIGFPTAAGAWLFDGYPWRGAQSTTVLVSGQLWDTSGQPAIGVSPLWGNPPTGSTLGAPAPVSDSTGAAGVLWQITGAGAATGSVTVRAGQYTPAVSVPYTVTPRPTQVNVVAGAMLQGGSSSITVQVRDALGSALAGVPVHFAVSWPDRTVYGVGVNPTGCITSSEGRCTVTATAAANATVGPWRVTAAAAGAVGSDDGDVLVSPARILSGAIEVRSGESGDLILRVVDGRGDDVDGVPVSVTFPSDSGLSAVPDSTVTVNGRALFRIDADEDTGAGEYDMDVTAGVLEETFDVTVLPAPGLIQIESSTVQVSRGDTVEVDVEVLSSDLEPVGGVVVLTTGGRDGLRVTSRTTTIGAGPNEGRAVLVFAADGDADVGTTTVEVSVAGLTPVTITVQVT